MLSSRDMYSNQSDFTTAQMEQIKCIFLKMILLKILPLQYEMMQNMKLQLLQKLFLPPPFSPPVPNGPAVIIFTASPKVVGLSGVWGPAVKMEIIFTAGLWLGMVVRLSWIYQDRMV